MDDKMYLHMGTVTWDFSTSSSFHQTIQPGIPDLSFKMFLTKIVSTMVMEFELIIVVPCKNESYYLQEVYVIPHLCFNFLLLPFF